MTFPWLGRNEDAIAALDRRIALGGWTEEVLYAKLSKARSAHGHRPWADVLALRRGNLCLSGRGPRRGEGLLARRARAGRAGRKKGECCQPPPSSRRSQTPILRGQKREGNERES